MTRISLFALAVLAAAVPASAAKSMPVRITNNSLADRTQTIEIPVKAISDRLGSAVCYVLAPDGSEIPSQTTFDSLLVFKANVPAAAQACYKIVADKEPHTYPVVCTGRAYPERADDVAWENNLVGFRVYGPATQQRGEKAYGYDLFFKYPSEAPVVESLYAAHCSAANWARVDSLRKIDRRKAKEFENSISYHVDNGKGMDCYAVGATLGAGMAVPVVGDSLCFSWCYKKAKVLDSGPVRFTVRLTFAPRTIGNVKAVETRLISLDRDSHFNKCKVLYSALPAGASVACGFPLRDSSPAVMLADNGIIAYADPTQGPDNGKALLGVIFPDGFGRTAKASGHALGFTEVEPATPFTYYWGFAWNRTDITSLDKWVSHMLSARNEIKNPLTISY